MNLLPIFLSFLKNSSPETCRAIIRKISKAHSSPIPSISREKTPCRFFEALGVFPDLARDHLVRYGSGSSNPNFYEIAPVLAYGPNGLGYGKTCPRDGKPNCSLVDAVHETHRGKVAGGR